MLGQLVRTTGAAAVYCHGEVTYEGKQVCRRCADVWAVVQEVCGCVCGCAGVGQDRGPKQALLSCDGVAGLIHP